MKLSDVTKDLFEYIVSFRRGLESRSAPDVGAVRQDFERIFSDMESRVAGDPELKNEYAQVKYALVATADESILNSSWSEARKWDRYLLEQRYFSSNIAGNQFFKMLERVEQMPKEVLKTFYTCLAFGFHGGFAADDPSLLRLRSRLLQRFMPDKEEPAAALFPDAYQVQVGRAMKLQPLWRIWHVVVGVLVLTVILVAIESTVIWPLMVGNLDKVIESTSPVQMDSRGRVDAPMVTDAGGVAAAKASGFAAGYLVQHGAFDSQDLAASLVSELAKVGISASLYAAAGTGGARKFIVMEGPLPNIESAAKALETARSKSGGTASVNILDAKTFAGTCVAGCPPTTAP